MGWFSQQLQTACADDLRDQNNLAVNTLIALDAYELMYNAACAKDPTSNTYCYVDAVANQNPSDLYLYQLPLGISLPNTVTNMSCSPCSGDLFGIYAAALENKTSANALSALKSTYESAADFAAQQCGNTFATTNIASGAMALRASTGMGVLGAALGIWTLFF